MQVTEFLLPNWAVMAPGVKYWHCYKHGQTMSNVFVAPGSFELRASAGKPKQLKYLGMSWNGCYIFRGDSPLVSSQRLQPPEVSRQKQVRKDRKGPWLHCRSQHALKFNPFFVLLFHPFRISS